MGEIKREDLFNYSFYNDNGLHVAVLNVEKLKEILQVDDVILKEDYGKD